MSGHTTPSRLLALAALVVAGLLSNSCGGPTDPSDNVIETFTGTVPFVTGMPQGSQHAFNVSNNGELIITLVSLTPPLAASKYAALLLGVSSGPNCTYDGTVQNLFAVPGTVLSLPARKGAFCIAIVDKGDFTEAEAYELRVSHP